MLFRVFVYNMKLSARLRECDDRLTEVRNEYLLALAAVNAHHRHYLSNDLPRIMEVNTTYTHVPVLYRQPRWPKEKLKSIEKQHFFPVQSKELKQKKKKELCYVQNYV